MKVVREKKIRLNSFGIFRDSISKLQLFIRGYFRLIYKLVIITPDDIISLEKYFGKKTKYISHMTCISKIDFFIVALLYFFGKSTMYSILLYYKHDFNLFYLSKLCWCLSQTPILHKKEINLKYKGKTLYNINWKNIYIYA